MRIGIDHLAVYTPNQYLSLEDLAKARGVDPNKYVIGIGIREISIPSASEDVVVMAANAGYRVLKEAGVSPRNVGLLIVGTESSEDRAKPTATHVHYLLEIQNSCRVYDVVHACAGATFGVLSAIDWLAGKSENTYALVIASDVAKYGLGSPGEPTQGAGAVALLIGKNPRLMVLEEQSVYSKNVYDFWRPWDKQYPIVKGVFSTQCYVEAVEQCFKNIKINQNNAFLYHIPYPKLVQQAHAKVVQMMGNGLEWKKHYEEQVSISSEYSSRIGNIYTGSLWLSLANYLEFLLNHKDNHPDYFKNCYLFSYGSGCAAVLMQGELSADWVCMAKQLQCSAMLDNRLKLSIDDYEKWFDPQPSVAAHPSANSYFKFTGSQNDEKTYARNEIN